MQFGKHAFATLGESASLAIYLFWILCDRNGLETCRDTYGTLNMPTVTIEVGCPHCGEVIVDTSEGEQTLSKIVAFVANRLL